MAFDYGKAMAEIIVFNPADGDRLKAALGRVESAISDFFKGSAGTAQEDRLTDQVVVKLGREVNADSKVGASFVSPLHALACLFSDPSDEGYVL